MVRGPTGDFLTNFMNKRFLSPTVTMTNSSSSSYPFYNPGLVFRQEMRKEHILKMFTSTATSIQGINRWCISVSIRISAERRLCENMVKIIAHIASQFKRLLMQVALDMGDGIVDRLVGAEDAEPLIVSRLNWLDIQLVHGIYNPISGYLHFIQVYIKRLFEHRCNHLTFLRNTVMKALDNMLLAINLEFATNEQLGRTAKLVEGPGKLYLMGNTLIGLQNATASSTTTTTPQTLWDSEEWNRSMGSAFANINLSELNPQSIRAAIAQTSAAGSGSSRTGWRNVDVTTLVNQTGHFAVVAQTDRVYLYLTLPHRWLTFLANTSPIEGHGEENILNTLKPMLLATAQQGSGSSSSTGATITDRICSDDKLFAAILNSFPPTAVVTTTSGGGGTPSSTFHVPGYEDLLWSAALNSYKDALTVQQQQGGPQHQLGHVIALWYRRLSHILTLDQLALIYTYPLTFPMRIALFHSMYGMPTIVNCVPSERAYKCWIGVLVIAQLVLRSSQQPGDVISAAAAAATTNNSKQFQQLAGLRIEAICGALFGTSEFPLIQQFWSNQWRGIFLRHSLRPLHLLPDMKAIASEEMVVVTSYVDQLRNLW
jgi:hypothetical protein